MTVGDVRAALVAFANDLEANPYAKTAFLVHCLYRSDHFTKTGSGQTWKKRSQKMRSLRWMAEKDPNGVALNDLPPEEQPAFRDSFMWTVADSKLRLGPAATTTAISIEPTSTLTDDTQSLRLAGLSENSALYLERGAAQQDGQVLLSLYRIVQPLHHQQQQSSLLDGHGGMSVGVSAVTLPSEPGCLAPLCSADPHDASKALAEPFSDGMTLAELKEKLVDHFKEGFVEAEAAAAVVPLPPSAAAGPAADDAERVRHLFAPRVRLRFVAGSGDKRRPRHPTALIKAGAGTKLGALARELKKCDGAVAVSLLPEPELLMPADKVFMLWQLQPVTAQNVSFA